NTIYFGRGAYGIEVAAQEYFGKSASELNVSESALLAAVIPAPSAWDPANDREAAEQRWNRVLNLMVEDGWLSQADREAAEFPERIAPNEENSYGGPNGQLRQMLRNELVNEAGMREEEIDTRGLDIVTAIDERSQEAAVQAVDNL